MVDRSADRASFSVRVRITSADPCDIASWQMDELSWAASSVPNVDHAFSIKLTALEPQAFKLDCRVSSYFVMLKAWHEFELIDCYLQATSWSLPQSIQECFRMKEVAQVNWFLQKLLLLNFLHPRQQCGGFFVDNPDPQVGILWSLPQGVPTGWHCTFQQLRSFFLALGRKHLGALENSHDCLDTFVNNANNFFDINYLHINECFNWIRGINLVTAQLNSFKRIFLVQVRP